MSIRQSYKVFIGDSCIRFGGSRSETPLAARTLADPSFALMSELISELETSETSTVFINGDLTLNWERFTANYRIIEAGGGLVANAQGELLFIYRNGRWDLPKGKLEKGETIADCAKREVAEECGIDEPDITGVLSPTYHTYTLKGDRILKETHWFLMASKDGHTLKPQTEEGITEVRWASADEARTLAEGSYGSVKDVISEGLFSD